MDTRRVLFVATREADHPAEGHELWQAAIRRVLPSSDALLVPTFAVVTTVAELEAKLGAEAWDVIHAYEHDRGLLINDTGGRPNQLQVINRYYAERSDDPERHAPLCALLTETSSQPGRETAPVPGIVVTVRMSGSLEDAEGPALAFAGGFYGALAAGLALPAAVSEGRASAANASSDSPFEATMFEHGLRVAARVQPFDELRRLKESARSIAQSIRAVQRQLSHSSRLSAGDLLGDRYVLDDKITTGTFTELWRAYDREARRIVVVKVLHEAWVRNPGHLEQFERSTREMKGLDSPHVVEIIAAARSDRPGRSFYVTRWYEGGDLGHAVREGTLDTTAALRVCADALMGLAAAHERGFVHRAFSPEHVLIDEHGRGVVSDFDLERSDQARSLRGVVAPTYAAPEMHPVVDASADLYSAGLCVLFVLAGQDPDHGAPLTLLDQVHGCSEKLREALALALAHDPAERTLSCAELAALVRELASTPEHERKRRLQGWSGRGRDVYGRWACAQVGELELRMRWIEPGTFSMGSYASADMSHLDIGWRRAEPVHTVVLSHGFWLAETECTQALWSELMGDNPSHFEDPHNPVENVSWVQIRRFLAKLDERVGGGPPFCLPTEAQWEYACRAETRTHTYAGPMRPLSEIAWYADNSREAPRHVRQKQANKWGLHDTLGNVWEWCADGPRVYGPDATVDPVGPTERTAARVIRGGGWLSSRNFGVRAADRISAAKTTTDRRVGFRLARLPE